MSRSLVLITFILLHGTNKEFNFVYLAGRCIRRKLSRRIFLSSYNTNESLYFSLDRAALLLRRYVYDVLFEHDLSPEQWEIFQYIDFHGGVTQRELTTERCETKEIYHGLYRGCKAGMDIKLLILRTKKRFYCLSYRAR